MKRYDIVLCDAEYGKCTAHLVETLDGEWCKYSDVTSEPPISRRDYFAAIILKGMTRRQEYGEEQLARYVVRATDALIRELDK